MPELTLGGCHILVVEDEYMLATDLRSELQDQGAIVVGPIGTVDQGIALFNAEAASDGAILYLNLRGEMVYPLADLLIRRGVAFIFTTGYDRAVIPSRFDSIVRCEKPLDMRKVTQAIGRAMHRAE